jgi:hypothetical protein
LREQSQQKPSIPLEGRQTKACSRRRKNRAVADARAVSRTPVMQTAWIQFKKWPYEEGVFHLEIAASYDGYAAFQDFYIGASEIASLATRLQSFPSDVKDEIILASGERGTTWAHAVNLRFWVYDSAGHCAIAFDVSNNAAEPYTRNACFTIRCEAASLNQLGKDIATWIATDEESVVTELTTV